MSSQVFAGDTSGSITIQAPAVAGTNILTLPTNTGTLMVSSANTILNAGYAPILPMSSGLIPGELIYRLDSTVTGTATTSAQPVFGVGVTVSGSTVYQFEAMYYFVKSAGTTAHTVALLFGGTATINNISYNAFWNALSSGFNSYNTGGGYTGVTQATATTLTSSQTSASLSTQFLIKGTVSINAGGTFIPQYQLSAAPGGAYTTQIGSYFKLSPLGASGANTSIGTWA